MKPISNPSHRKNEPSNEPTIEQAIPPNPIRVAWMQQPILNASLESKQTHSVEYYGPINSKSKA